MRVQSTVLLKQENGEVATEIIDVVCDKLMVDRELMLSTSRLRKVTLPRCIAMYYIRRYTALSLKKIGKIFGRDHSTVIYNIALFDDLLRFDAEFKHLVARVNL